MVQIILNGGVVAKSQNLRGIYDYARKKSAIRSIRIYRNMPKWNEAIVVIDFTNGAHCCTTFADHGVAFEWANKNRCWGLVLSVSSSCYAAFKERTQVSHQD